jgi:ubiquinone/menaquinone biosynthesis C-methylase UbiE
VSEVHPEAELVGADLSARQLRMGHLAAERCGVAVMFKQRDVRDTGEPDESFDAVVIHSLMHEQPVELSRDVLTEMFRILKPGGDIVVSDPPPFRAVPLFRAVLLDWETKNREEPYFSQALSQDWADEMRAIGFIDTENRALGAGAFPYVAIGRKPVA